MSNKPALDLQSQDIHLAQYWAIIYKRWKVAAAIFLTVLAGTYLFSQLSKPLYRSAIVLQIEHENSNSLTVADLFGIEPTSQEFLQTQYALLKSRGLAERIADDLHLLRDQELNPGGTAGKNASQLAGIRSSIVGQISGGIDVKPIEWTSLVEVGYVAPSPRLAQKVAEGIGQSYTAMALEKAQTTNEQASSFLTSQIDQTNGEIADLSKQLQTYGESKNIVSLGSGNPTVGKLDDLNKAFTQAQNDRIHAQTSYQSLVSGDPAANPDVLADPTVVQAQTELGRLQNDYAQKLSTFKPEYPQMVSQRNQIEKARQGLASAIQEALVKVRQTAKTNYDTALSRERQLADAVDAQKHAAMQQNSDAVTYTSLQTSIDTKRQLLDQLTKKRNEAQVTTQLSNSTGPTVSIVDHAQLPTSRFNETMTKNLKNAIPLGLVLGLAAVFFLEYLDRSIKSPEEMERTTGYASLGIIPSGVSMGTGYGYYTYGKKLRAVDSEPISIDMIPFNNPRSPISEAYRAFRTSLLLASANSPRVMVITSTSPREGKTTTAVNLAIVLAQMGQEVLIIDGDLRKPRLHKIFGAARNEGLVNYLASGAAPEALIQKTAIPNLLVITSGPIPPNPAELLASPRMRDFLTTLRSRFAYIILDSPPLLAVTDSVILASMSDGVVLCIHGGATARELVQRASDRLRQSNVTVLGTLLNNLDLSQHAYGFGKHYYSYYHEAEPEELPVTKGRGQPQGPRRPKAL